MLAVTASHPFSDEDWWFEPKWDGYRAVISVGRTLHIYSRNGHDLLQWYPMLQAVERDLPHPIVLDAELVAWVDGRPSFSTLQQRIGPQYLLMVFDCLYTEERWILHEPLARRLEMLHQNVRTSDLIVVTEGVKGQGVSYFEAICNQGLEGVMAKRLDGRYFAGRRSPVWKKFLALHVDWFWVTTIHEVDSRWFWSIEERCGDHWKRVAKLVAPSRWSPPIGHEQGIQTFRPFRVELDYRERTREGYLRHARIRQWVKPNASDSSENFPSSSSHLS